LFAGNPNEKIGRPKKKKTGAGGKETKSPKNEVTNQKKGDWNTRQKKTKKVPWKTKKKGGYWNA